jgi:hypothetical protein
MITHLRNTLLVAFAAIALAPCAVAGPIQWTASGVTFNSNAGSITGSFDYDADTSTFSNIDLVSEGMTFTDLVSALSMNGQIGATDATGNLSGDPLVIVIFHSGFTDSGGTDTVSDAIYGSCFNASCSMPDAMYNGGVGSFTGTAVSAAPEPASILLTAAGLAALGAARRRFL